MDDPRPILTRFALRGEVAEFSARPGTGWLAAYCVVLLAGVLGALGLWVLWANPLWQVLAVLLGGGLLFAGVAWVVAARGMYTARLDFGANRLRITEVRGLEKPAVWEGALTELSAITIEQISGSGGPWAPAVVMLLTWQDEQTPPLRVHLAANQVDSAELAAFRQLAAGRGLMSPPDVASGHE